MDVPAAQVFNDCMVTPRKLPREFCSDHSRRREYSDAGQRKRNAVRRRELRASLFANLRERYGYLKKPLDGDAGD
jgi:hypothetical protein